MERVTSGPAREENTDLLIKEFYFKFDTQTKRVTNSKSGLELLSSFPQLSQQMVQVEVHAAAVHLLDQLVAVLDVLLVPAVVSGDGGGECHGLGVEGVSVKVSEAVDDVLVLHTLLPETGEIEY